MYKNNFVTVYKYEVHGPTLYTYSEKLWYVSQRYTPTITISSMLRHDYCQE
jgi:hypothetical protein